MKVELIRHAKTLLQTEHRYVGSTDDSLSPEGAQTLAPARHSPTRIYVTSLRRTSQTARIVFPKATLVVVPGLEEMDFGAFERHSHAELEHDTAYNAWLDGMCVGRCPGGESRDEFALRVTTAFASLLDRVAQQGEKDSIIVAHSGTIMAIMERFGRPQQEFFAWQVEHGCGILLDASSWTDNQTLRFVKKTSHRRKGIYP